MNNLRAARQISAYISQAPTIMAIDAGKPITVIAGIHAGCFELYAAEGIQGVADLEGRTVVLRVWAQVHTCMLQAWPAMSGWTRVRTSGG